MPKYWYKNISLGRDDKINTPRSWRIIIYFDLTILLSNRFSKFRVSEFSNRKFWCNYADKKRTSRYFSADLCFLKKNYFSFCFLKNFSFSFFWKKILLFIFFTNSNDRWVPRSKQMSQGFYKKNLSPENIKKKKISSLTEPQVIYGYVPNKNWTKKFFFQNFQFFFQCSGQIFAHSRNIYSNFPINILLQLTK